MSFSSRYHRLLFLIFLLSFFTNSGSGQHFEKCAFDRHLGEWQQKEEFQRIRIQAENFLQQYQSEVSSRNMMTTNIPVVVHVFHTGQSVGTATSTGANPSDAQIMSAISNMNNAFTHTGPYASLTGYTSTLDVNFSLAQRDPNGNATSGIVRHDVSGETWGTTFANQGMDAGATPGVLQATMAEGRYWPPMDYMNIYIVHVIENAMTTLGFASFPQSNPGATDGMVMLASAFGYDPENDDGFLLDPGTNLNGTANHETGHYFNLYHTFTGDNGGSQCPSDITCGVNNDCCADIPPHQRSSGCPSDNPTGNTCTGGPNSYIHNFMDYADDACFHGFSTDQTTRMAAALVSQRCTLGQSQGLSGPSGMYPAAVTSNPSVSNPDQSMGIYEVTLNGTTISSWSSYHDGGYINRVASAPTISLQSNTAYNLTVQVGVNNSSNNELVNVYLDYNNDGDFDDMNEEVFVAPAGTGKKNGDVFTINFTTPATVLSNQRVRMRILSDFDDGVNPLPSSTTVSNGGQIEDYAVSIAMVLPVELLSFTGTLVNSNEVLLNWKTAGEINNAGFYIERKYQNQNFETIGFENPAASEYGNGTYHFKDKNLKPGIWYYRLLQMDQDGTFTYSNQVAISVQPETHAFKVYPNPSYNGFTITFEEPLDHDFTLQLFDNTGRKIVEKKYSGTSTPLIIGQNLNSGVYFLKIQSVHWSRSKRLIKMG